MNSPEPATPARKFRWLPSPVAVTGLVLAGLLQFGGPSSAVQQAERNEVAACWAEARSPSGSAMDQRNKVAECEGKESAFRKKSGGTTP